VLVTLRIDTPIEVEYYRHGGILLYVLRQILGFRLRHVVTRLMARPLGSDELFCAWTSSESVPFRHPAFS